MAQIVAPTANEVAAYTGISGYLTGEGLDAFAERIDGYVADVEADLALIVGEARYDGDLWTARQATVIKRALAFRAGILMLNFCLSEKALGTHEPLLMEDADAIARVIGIFHDSARSLEGLVLNQTDTPPIALPAARSSTFAFSSDDLRPAGKNLLLDERDNASAGDVETKNEGL